MMRNDGWRQFVRDVQALTDHKLTHAEKQRTRNYYSAGLSASSCALALISAWHTGSKPPNSGRKSHRKR